MTDSHVTRRTFLSASALVASAAEKALAQRQNHATETSLVKQRADALLLQMTLEEKIGQLTQVGGIALTPDAPKPEDSIRKGHAGSVLWISDAATINRLQKIAVEETRLKIPLIFGLDVIHGFKTIFPMPLALAASWDPVLIERVQSIAAREARAAGIAWTFAPMVDIARDPRWGRMIEGAGEDPFLGAMVARAQVRGFQGEGLNRPDCLLACAKHFAGYGAATGGRDYDSAFVSDSELYNVYLPPFKAALDAGVGTFMSAYMDLNDVPATGNAFLLQEVLRKAWKFQGFVVSDAFAVADLVTHGFARDARDAAHRAFAAGVNMDMASGTYMNQLRALVTSKQISESALDEAVRPVLTAKFRLGLFEQPYVDEEKAKKISGAREHLQAAREAAQRTAVLLRNEGSLLPLTKDRARSIAVIGPLANAKREMLTMWSGFGVDSSSVVTVYEGIRRKVAPDVRVDYATGVQIAKQYSSMFEEFMGAKAEAPWSEERTGEEFEKAMALARSSDLVILALGELALMSGELASQSSLEFPGRQQQLMEAVVATGKPVVLVLVNGRPLNITWASEHVPSILEAWHPGMQAGDAIADLLFGDASPSGKLPVTWPRDAGQIPIYYARNLTHKPEFAPDFTSRYWDQPSKPLYPFGFGLTYSQFAVSNLRVGANEVKLGTSVQITADIENAGTHPGSEVVQLYIHQKAGRASRPARELKGFERISLSPREKRTVRFHLGKNELSYWSAQASNWVQDAADFDVWIGFDSTAKMQTSFRVIE
jgi:beta-glucosidase